MSGEVLSEDINVVFSENEIYDIPEEKTTVIIAKHELTAGQKSYLALKRIADFFISLVSLIILVIPFLIVAAIQKIADPKEPVFFIQERIGKDKRIIKVTKFRSMKSSAPHYCSTSNFSNDGEYITPFCRFLRNSSIDELPQLIQVFTGKMSLIGPRPLIPQEENVHKMREAAGIYQLRPGITGWAQVNGRDLVNDDDKVRLDYDYLKKIGFRIDLKIFFLTIKTVLKKSDIADVYSENNER